MDCQKYNQLLDDYIDGELAPAKREAFEAHTRACARCQAALGRARQLQDLLRHQPIAPPRPGFHARVLPDRDVARAGRPAVWAFGGALSGAVTALLLVWVTLFQGGGHRVELVVDQVQAVNLVFNVPRDLTDSEISLQLPEGFELDGYPGQQDLRWTAPLYAGANTLTLPIRALSGESGELIAKIEYNGTEQREFRIQLHPRVHRG